MNDEMNSEEPILKSQEEQVEASRVAFADVEPEGNENGNGQNMDFLLEIPLEISVELGKKRISIGELLKLSQGSVVELDKLTDQPLDIFINNKLMAEGEVVVVNERFGIRLLNIISPKDRVRELT